MKADPPSVRLARGFPECPPNQSSTSVPTPSRNRLRRCAAPWPRPKSATTSTAKTRPFARLEERTAELLGKEAALFTPSGTMANQIAIGAQAEPGDELICDKTAHVYVWEAGGIARHWGVTTRTIPSKTGLIELADLEGTIRPDDGHYVRTRLVCLENTHNRGGGRVQPLESIDKIAAWARSNGVSLHLDGAD